MCLPIDSMLLQQISPLFFCSRLRAEAEIEPKGQSSLFGDSLLFENELFLCVFVVGGNLGGSLGGNLGWFMIWCRREPRQVPRREPRMVHDLV